MALDPAWIALIGTVCGGVGLKVTERWLDRPKQASEDATRIRDELRLQITAQQEEIKELEAEVNKWRSDYYNLRDQYVKLQTDLTLALERLKAENLPVKPIDPPPKV